MKEYENHCSSGMVYIMTNDAECNQVAAFRRQPDGKLSPFALYKTGGQGTGPNPAVDPLVSQGSLRLSRDGSLLFAVNAGSNSISSFCVADDGALALADVKCSGGIRPNSLDSFGHLLYVSNAGSGAPGGSSNIAGFWVGDNGELHPIPGSIAGLSTPGAHPASVLFSPCGMQLVVSEQNTSRLTVFKVNRDGTVSLQMINNSNGEGPFGTTILSSGLLLVSEAGANALSSYALCKDGSLRVISGSVPTNQNATCWVVHSVDGFNAFASNTGSGTISSYRLNMQGALMLLENTQSTPKCIEQGAPIDSGVSPDGHFFYVLNGNQGSISAFRICGCGNLIGLQVLRCPEIPALGTQGLAVR